MLGGCSSSGGSSAQAQSFDRLTPEETRQQLDRLQPTTHVFAGGDAAKLWEATRGYMQRAFPLEDGPPGDVPVTVAAGERRIRYVESKLIEWIADGFAHRTRVMVRMVPDGNSPTDLRIDVLSLAIEAMPQFEEAQEGRPLAYVWQLQGSNPAVERVVRDNIVRRYLCILEGRPIPAEEDLVLPSVMREPARSGL